MTEFYINLIDKIFPSSDDITEVEDDYINILFSNYTSSNEETRILLYKKLVDVLNRINTCYLNRWCLVLSKLLTYSSSNYEAIIDIFIPKLSNSYSKSEIIGKKLALLVILEYLTPRLHEIKISSEILTKLLFFNIQFIHDGRIGMMVSLVLSRYIKTLSLDEFQSSLIKMLFEKEVNLEQSPHFYPILLSLKDEHKKFLRSENVKLPDFQSKDELMKFIDNFKKLNNRMISAYLNLFVVSDLFKTFWDLFIESVDTDKMIYSDKEVLLNCLFETICPLRPSTCVNDSCKSIDIVWSNRRMWQLFLSNLYDNKSLFQNLCRSTVFQLKSNKNINIKASLLGHYISTFDKDFLHMESKIPENYRLSQALMSSSTDPKQLLRYIETLMKYYESKNFDDNEKVFIIEQLTYVCQCSLHTKVHNSCINHIINIQTVDLAEMSYLSEKIKIASFKSLIFCIYYSVTSRNISMAEYLIYLKSLIETVIGNLSHESLTFSVPLKLFKSLSKYIDEQLEFKYNNEDIITKVFPCFGAVICYLSLFFLSKIDLKECEKSLSLSNQIIDWIKEVFQAAKKSIDSTNSNVELPSRKRMLSISSLCSEDENNDGPSVEHWSFNLLDILLKLCDEDSTLMNEVVKSIVSVMIRTKTLEISGVRYLKNLILSEKVRQRKLTEFESVIQPDNATISTNCATHSGLKSRHLKERCFNILSTVILEGNDLDLIASSLFIMLDLCSSGEKFLLTQIETLINNFKQNTKPVHYYISSENSTRAFNSILVLSSDVLNCNTIVEIASNMLIGLIKRTELNENENEFLKTLLENTLFGSINNFQKSILQNVFMEHTKLALSFRQSLISCIENQKSLRLSKYKAFSILLNIIKSNEFEKNELFLNTHNEFVSKMIPLVIIALSSMDFKNLNVKYASILLESLIGLFIVDKTVHKLPEDLLNNLTNVLKDKNRPEFFGLINKFIGIYKNKMTNIQMVSFEKLQEYDEHVSYLLKLLPPGFVKDLETDTLSNLAKGAVKPVKRSNKFSKFDLQKNSGKVDKKSKKICRNLNENSFSKSDNKKRKIENISESNVNVKASDVSDPQTPKVKKSKNEKLNQSIKPVDLEENPNKSKVKKSKKLKHKERKLSSSQSNIEVVNEVKNSSDEKNNPEATVNVNNVEKKKAKKSKKSKNIIPAECLVENVEKAKSSKDKKKKKSKKHDKVEAMDVD